LHLFHLLDHSLIGRAAEPALEWQDQISTFGQIESRSNQFAHLLTQRGLRPGDRLAVYLPNSPEFIHLFLACLKLGAIFVPINILYRERELSHILKDSDPHLHLTAADLTDWNESASAQPTSRPVTAPLNAETPACLIYTSGTTGPSKGAILTHANFAANAMNISAAWGLTAADRLLLALPLFHVHGLANGILSWLLTGFRLRLLERFESSSTAREFASFQPTVFFGVPTMYVRMLEWPAVPPARLFVSGSAPLAPQTMQDFATKFGSNILERYGMTETLMIAGNPYHGERRPGSVGLPFPGVQIEIRDESGELYVKGPNVCAGYWRNPAATAAAFQDGWFQTGDIGSFSEDGYLTLEGRRSDLIIAGGFNIYPREIEEFLLEQPEIAEAAVAARPDPAKGEVPVAFLVLKSPLTPEALRDRCRQSLASFKVPRDFRFLESLPRNALGKIQKHLLGDQ
jgi:malonyl-CoA/methylmalonyl-CoA synthetase